MENMDKQADNKSRADIIKEARESCNRNLNPSIKGITSRNPRKTRDTYSSFSSLRGDNLYINPLKQILIKVLCAFAIFVAVVTVSSLDTRYETDYKDKIQTILTSDSSVERAQDFFVSILEKIANK